jgi:hypothetical protein
MTERNRYTDSNSRQIQLSGLDAQERRLVDVLKQMAEVSRVPSSFDAFWMREVSAFYELRKFSRKEIQQTVVYRIGQDLSQQLAIRLGVARQPDYRDRLEELIRTQFRSRREFCQATGLSEDMLSHVLARRKHLSVEALEQALGRIGYELTFTAKSVRKE